MFLYFLIVFSALLFFQGFFPTTTSNLKVNTAPPRYIRNFSLNEELYKTNVTKTIFLVIDALRLDFVNHNYMPLTMSLVEQQGCFNKINVQIPTVTLPRIKALTAGNIPQFIDLVLNLATTEILTDSIIHSASRQGKKIVFYGDDTWLKLFPNQFIRFEGTNSFFVRDFYEVDNNVTRNVNVEVEENDWDIMILHYLGLDHIGHVYGPFSSLIPTKLAEMDNIIYEAYKAVSTKHNNTILIVTGDHGMRDSGGHGGSTFSETNVPLLLIGLTCQNNIFQQTDIPVNLAVLLGLRIPSLAIGRVHKTLLQFSQEKYLYALYYNTFLLKQKHSCCNDLYEEASGYYIDYLKNMNNESAFKAVKLYEDCLDTISNHLSKVSVKQNLNYLTTALITMLNSLLILISELMSKTEMKSVIIKSMIMFFVILQYMDDENILLFGVVTLGLIFILMYNFYILFTSLKWFSFSNTLQFFIFCCILHPLTFLSSSYIEEEHQFWYFANILFLFIHAGQLSKLNNQTHLLFCVIFMGLCRFLRTINSTGDKWANYPDLSDWFLRDENIFWYQILFVSGLTLVFLMQYILMKPKSISVILNIVTLTFIFVFKQNETSLFLGRLIWFFIVVYYIYTGSNIMTWSLVLSLLLKPYNVILIPYCILSSLFNSHYYKKTEVNVLYNSFLGNMLFFAQGHSNSFASIDISIGYIGLSSYQPILVIGQVLCHTQAFPVLCHLLIFNNKEIDVSKAWKLLFCNRVYILFVTALITIIFRHHLFIWSVFAPKLFIEFSFVLFLFFEYLIYNLKTIAYLAICEINRLWKNRDLRCK